LCFTFSSGCLQQLSTVTKLSVYVSLRRVYACLRRAHCGRPRCTSPWRCPHSPAASAAAVAAAHQSCTANRHLHGEPWLWTRHVSGCACACKVPCAVSCAAMSGCPPGGPGRFCGGDAVSVLERWENPTLRLRRWLIGVAAALRVYAELRVYTLRCVSTLAGTSAEPGVQSRPPCCQSDHLLSGRPTLLRSAVGRRRAAVHETVPSSSVPCAPPVPPLSCLSNPLNCNDLFSVRVQTLRQARCDDALPCVQRWVRVCRT
jgi:hypothetical protein